MCNLYSQTKPPEAMRDLFGVKPGDDHSGNLPLFPAIFPDNDAPVARIGSHGRRELVHMRWGLPNPPGAKAEYSTNIRNLESSWWRPWLSTPEQRCLVPATSFAEPDGSRPAVWHWFALAQDRPLFAFAGLWREWTGERLKDVGEKRRRRVKDTWTLYAFLTCPPNAVVKPIHGRAMPVMLGPQDFDRWLAGSFDDVKALARPWPNDGLVIVGKGAKEDDPAKLSAVG